MAGFTRLEDGTIVNAGGIDVGYLAATQPDLLSDGIDTEEEILTWYANTGQMAGAPANYNEQLAREAGFQGNFTGGGLWDEEVEPYYAEGGANNALAPTLVYTVDGGWQARDSYTYRGVTHGGGLTDSYGAPTFAPDSGVWLGGGALDNGWIYKELIPDEDLITSGSGDRVLGAQEVYWDPDVMGSAAGAGIQDHRLTRHTSNNIRTADSNYNVNQTVSWLAFDDGPYNNFKNFDQFVKRMSEEGIWGDYTPKERQALAAGENIGLGFKEDLTGFTKKMGGYEMSAGQWATDGFDIATRHVNGLKASQADPGYWMGGSYGMAGMGKMLDILSWGDNPNFDRYAIGQGPNSISYRRKVNDFYGRADMPLLPSDHARYIADLQAMNGPANPRTDEEVAAYVAQIWEDRRNRNRDDYGEDPDPGNPNPPPDDDDEEVNPSMSIFTNSAVGFPDPDRFRFR